MLNNPAILGCSAERNRIVREALNRRHEFKVSFLGATDEQRERLIPYILEAEDLAKYQRLSISLEEMQRHYS
jgi:hypothetical protein